MPSVQPNNVFKKVATCSGLATIYNAKFPLVVDGNSFLLIY